MSLEIAAKELCKLNVKSENFNLAHQVIQNVSFAICTDSNRNVYQIPGFPSIYGVQGPATLMNDTACATISKACIDGCTKRNMTPLPFLDPQGKGCLGSCACIQKDSSDRVEGIFYGKDLIDLPLAKNSKFENRGSSFGPTFLIFGIYFLL